MSTSKPSRRTTSSAGLSGAGNAGNIGSGERPAPQRHNRRYGMRGEELAARWYAERGYRLVARNWRCRDGELDLVVARHGEVVFCEVKARTSDRFGLPAEAVTPAKQRRLRRLAAAFLAAAAAPDSSFSVPRGAQPRFDVASVLGDRVDVIESAF
jgi:putative endonuclease